MRIRAVCFSLILLLPMGARGQESTTGTPAATTPASPGAQAATSPAQQAPPSAPNGQAAQAPNATNTIRSNVRLVILDAVVVDKQGNAVTGLDKDQFQVQEDGVDQEIRNFETPGRYTPAADVTINSTADLDRLAPRAPVNIILLDEFNTLFEDMAFARYSLKKWLEKQPAKLDTPTMLVAVNLQKFDVLHDYTQNKEEILSALDHHFAAYPWQAHQYAWIPERFATAFYTLSRVAEASSGHFGHKNMIWIGRGLPNINLINFGVDGQVRVNYAVQQAVNELRDARVTLYTIDPAGVMVNPGRYGEEAALFDPFGGQHDFQALARATGGRNLYGRNDVDAEIGTSIRDGAAFYTMTYRPTNTTRDITKFRKIKVTVKNRPDLQVVTRQGYFDSRAPARFLANGDPSRKLAQELIGAETSTMVYDGLPMTLTAADQPGKYALHLDGRGVYWSPATDTEPRMAKLILMVTTFDKKNNIVKTDARSISVKASPKVQPTGPLTLPVVLDYQLDKNPKAVRARFVVRVVASGRMSTADLDLTKPLQATISGQTSTNTTSPTP